METSEDFRSPQLLSQYLSLFLSLLLFNIYEKLDEEKNLHGYGFSKFPLGYYSDRFSKRILLIIITMIIK